MKKFLYFLLCIFLFPLSSVCQETDLTADSLFIKARKQAFELKDYTQAIKTSKQALQKAPKYTDISIFLGRLYAWSNQIDSARQIFEQLNSQNIQDEDFYLAYGSLEYWNDQPLKATALVDKGILLHPTSQDLLLLKSKIDYSNDAYESAEKSVDRLLKLNPKHTEARALSKSIQEYVAKNALGINYNFVHFDKQFENNWHIVGLSYKRVTPIGSIIFKTNYANKFADNGLQFELEAYPRLSKIFYLYVGTGYSNNVGIFPRYRTGVSLYANLPFSFEGELGYRQLYFSKNIWMYTASIGKYYQNFWFNLKTYLTPNQENISQSYTGTIRYYTKGANDYLGFVIGTGLSPEENRSNLLDNATYKLKTFKVGAEYNLSINRTNLFSLSTTYYNQEFKPKEKGNQLDITFGYIKTF
ncbi:YaiO family outer membrane beta-barrel protein [Sphingobacterium sp. SRCM116780]|uniref:YaiO family outer membrane beta-barrel protein n=1 Tax=Sphingobacterium sp. SRCM116780 TaxID=2907623 RepID=UPI001F1CCC15|nr:YaiO family outer membrane beta-barrel protein [Sphingobacterium sp. SRCM116780]UIR54873.1 YaiO family outer membrane beta-barrel protein [Sphingobacterium sp. SRCM116780]